MLKDSMVIDYFANQVVLVKINAKEDTVMTSAYRVSAYPTLVLTDKNGAEIDRIVGYMEAPDFIQKLDDYRNGIGTLDDLLGRADTLAERTLYFEIAEKYKYRDEAEQAKQWFDKVIAAGQPTDSLSGESRMALADLFRRAKEYDSSRTAFEAIMKDFKGSYFAEDAEIWRAIVYRLQGDTAAAITAYKEFIKHYPDSEDNVRYAQGQIDKLEGKPAEAQ